MNREVNIKKIFTRAIKNHQNNNFLDARNFYEKILEIEPNHFESIFHLGTLLLQIGNFKKAKNFLNKAIEIKPNHIHAVNNLGITFYELGEFKIAKTFYERALKINPNYLESIFRLGTLCAEIGDYKKASELLSTVVEINPNHADAYHNLGMVFKELGEFQKAITYYGKAIEINPNHIATITNISILFKQIQLNKLNKNSQHMLKKIFLFLFKRNDVEHSHIFQNAKLVLLGNYDYGQLEHSLNNNTLLDKNIIKKLLKEELFHLMLQKSLNKDILLEKILTKLRHEILFSLFNLNKENLKNNLNFIISLAEQCFLNEYVFVQTDEEKNFVDKLKNLIKNNKEINELEIAILASFVPLHTFSPIVKKLLNYKSNNILFNDLITLQVKEFVKERELRNTINSYEKISNIISKKVREQYEINPYPRWRYTYKKLTANSLTILNNQIKPNKVNFSDKFNNPKILIAGCGTGKHIFIAQNYLNAKMLVVDLSKTSLAYAKRKVEQSGNDNVEFLHADILELKNLNRKFDIIESVGVLHHMKNPLKGLEVLLNFLEPHGYLKLGLYSQIARQGLLKVKKLVERNKLKGTVEDIRNFRKLFIYDEKKDHLFHQVSSSGDFYSTSSVRDLIFHVQEHLFTIPQISKILSNFKLEFLGFVNQPELSEYSKLYPKDKKNILLDNWNQFEMNNPNTFRDMYRFWVKKK